MTLDRHNRKTAVGKVTSGPRPQLWYAIAPTLQQGYQKLLREQCATMNSYNPPGANETGL